MAKDRLDLQALFESLIGSRNVYFQPPASVRMNYPCIRYNLAIIDNMPADNTRYLQGTAYNVIYITYNPDDAMIKILSQLPMSKFDRWYAADNLNHYVYTIFY